MAAAVALLHAPRKREGSQVFDEIALKLSEPRTHGDSVGDRWHDLVHPAEADTKAATTSEVRQVPRATCCNRGLVGHVRESRLGF